MTRAAHILTTIAVAVAAFAAADIAHEGLGHGGACLALGGKMLLLSSTFEDCSIHSRLIDGAGPVAGIMVALLSWVALRLLPPKQSAGRVFLCLLFAFAAFWNFGYLIKSGLFDQGDWAFVIAGLKPFAVWHAAIALLGVALYMLSIRLLAAQMRRHLMTEGGAGQTPFAFTALAYLAGAAIACLAAAFDPRGPSIIFTDAMPSSLGAIGLVLSGRTLTRQSPNGRIAVAASPAWIAIGLVCGAVFVALLGPGLKVAG